MPVLTNNQQGFTVVVERNHTISAVRASSSAVKVLRQPQAQTVEKDTRVAEVAAAGPQGPAGPPGPGDNETFDANLALLYQISKL